MSRTKRLVNAYAKFIAIPWRNDAASAQRVIFCVYNENDELRLRAGIDEFEMVSRDAGHDWAIFDLTDTFSEWISKQKYARSYFQKPHLLPTLLPKYQDYITVRFKAFLAENGSHENSVVALKGVGSLFGFLKVKDIVDQLAPMVTGRLVVFFPGSHENNNYRLLDGYDGWNYLAIPISADKDT